MEEPLPVFLRIVGLSLTHYVFCTFNNRFLNRTQFEFLNATHSRPKRDVSYLLLLMSHYNVNFHVIVLIDIYLNFQDIGTCHYMYKTKNNFLRSIMFLQTATKILRCLAVFIKRCSDPVQKRFSILLPPKAATLATIVKNEAFLERKRQEIFEKVKAYRSLDSFRLCSCKLFAKRKLFDISLQFSRYKHHLILDFRRENNWPLCSTSKT